jgi:hypothetical protein
MDGDVRKILRRTELRMIKALFISKWIKHLAWNSSNQKSIGCKTHQLKQAKKAHQGTIRILESKLEEIAARSCVLESKRA